MAACFPFKAVRVSLTQSDFTPDFIDTGKHKTGGIMEGYDWYVFTWLLVIGFMTGTVFGMIIRKEGISLTGNILTAMISLPLAGLLSVLLDVGETIVFGFLCTMAVLFLVNVFHYHHKADLGEDLKDIARINRSILPHK